ncbi:MAG: hypothetical protein FWE09_02360 [Treponema sp.]|nr:hypothetical protein [Treponema sp.]
MKKTAFLALALFLLAGVAFASVPGQRGWWLTLQRGQVMFDRGDYGNALLAFEDARRERMAMFDRMERDLIDALSLPEVRRLGDALDWVDQALRDWRLSEAAAALDELFFRVPRASFGNSLAAALEAFWNLRYFPEAEIWIGRTFMASGEFGLALAQFGSALERRDLFENPVLITETLYDMAWIYRARREFQEMERALQSILEESALWTGTGENWQSGTFARDAMTRTLQLDGVERLLVLYRYDDARGARAHRELGFFYLADGRHARAQEHLMFALVIQSTAIIDELIRRRFDFTFTGLPSLAAEIARDPTLSAYALDSEYFRVIFYLANALHGNGHAARARELWTFLARHGGAGEWQARAATQLVSPQIGATSVMP